MPTLNRLPLLLSASPASGGLPPAVVGILAGTAAPAPDMQARIERALIDAGICDEQPSASWSRCESLTTCEVTLWREGVHVGAGIATVPGTDEAATDAAWLAALGRALVGVAAQSCGCPECSEDRRREREAAWIEGGAR